MAKLQVEGGWMEDFFQLELSRRQTLLERELRDGFQLVAVSLESVSIRVCIESLSLLRRNQAEIEVNRRRSAALIPNLILGFLKRLEDVEHRRWILLRDF